ncbi:hypothetical protein CEXT_387021 [Caerostris extrusa]|uniref:Uncharacterized protein n=1 Tax=Caerostris extrusa TaxID=172846 RepID=A0AAV4TX13_CAEEX|nr:hypothetical protein CEXT_387021 [Caerostris extrusa]
MVEFGKRLEKYSKLPLLRPQLKDCRIMGFPRIPNMMTAFCVEILVILYSLIGEFIRNDIADIKRRPSSAGGFKERRIAIMIFSVVEDVFKPSGMKNLPRQVKLTSDD